MEHLTGNPSDVRMRFFTPDRFVRFNSADDDVADRADAEWEGAIAGYRSHLAALQERLPVHVRRLAELTLHDADLVGVNLAAEPLVLWRPDGGGLMPSWSKYVALSLRQGDLITTLFYGLWDDLRESPRPDGWPFSTARRHWLFDEVDLAPASIGTYLHRIFWSDGQIIEVPFTFAMIHTCEIAGRTADLSLKTA